MTSQAVWREANPPVFGRGAPKRMLEHSLARRKGLCWVRSTSIMHCAGSVGSLWQFKVDLFVPTQTINSSAAIPSSTYQSTRPICIHQSAGSQRLVRPRKDDGNPSSVAYIVPPRSLCSLANAHLLSARLLLAAIHLSPGDRARCTDPPESISLVSPHRHRPSPLPRRDELLHSYSTVKNNPPRCLRRKSLEPDRLSPRS